MLPNSINLKTFGDSEYNIQVYQITRELPFYENFSHRYYYLKKNDEGNIYFHKERYNLFCIIHNNEEEYLSAIRKFVADKDYEFYFFLPAETAKELIELRYISDLDLRR